VSELWLIETVLPSLQYPEIKSLGVDF